MDGRLGAPVPFVTKGLTQDCEVLRCQTPPSGVSIRTEGRRFRFNCGEARPHQSTEIAFSFLSVSILVKGGWKETRGVKRPISAQSPVSESRMASLNAFETKTKKNPLGASTSVRDLKVAEEVGFEPTVGFPPRRFSSPGP